jgi:hypothetical protein
MKAKVQAQPRCAKPLFTRRSQMAANSMAAKEERLHGGTVSAARPATRPSAYLYPFGIKDLLNGRFIASDAGFSIVVAASRLPHARLP